MFRALIAVAITFCLIADPALAEKRTRLFASGHWALDRVDGLVMPYGKDQYTLDAMCNAYSPTGGVQLTLTMPAKDKDPANKDRDFVFIRVTSPKWNFAYREAPMYLVGGDVIGAENAWYYGNSVTWEPAASQPNLVSFMANAGKSTLFVGNAGPVESKGNILVLDASDRVVGQIPADGLRQVYAKLKACAGLR